MKQSENEKAMKSSKWSKAKNEIIVEDSIINIKIILIIIVAKPGLNVLENLNNGLSL